MSDEMSAKMRMERIDRLLRELEYEVTRGIMENEINEEIGFRFVIPVSRKIPLGIAQLYTLQSTVSRT